MKHNIKFNANWVIRRKYSRYPICSGFGEVCFDQGITIMDFIEFGMKVKSYIHQEHEVIIKTAESDIVKIQQKLKEAGKLFLYIQPVTKDVTIKDFFTEISYDPKQHKYDFFNVSYKRKQ